jgi:hypothetical protein
VRSSWSWRGPPQKGPVAVASHADAQKLLRSISEAILIIEITESEVSFRKFPEPVGVIKLTVAFTLVIEKTDRAAKLISIVSGPAPFW